MAQMVEFEVFDRGCELCERVPCGQHCASPHGQLFAHQARLSGWLGPGAWGGCCRHCIEIMERACSGQQISWTAGIHGIVSACSDARPSHLGDFIKPLLVVSLTKTMGDTGQALIS